MAAYACWITPERLRRLRWLGPLGALANGLRSEHGPRGLSNRLLDAAVDLPVQDRARLIRICCEKLVAGEPLDRILDMSMALPPAHRWQALAGLASQPYWVRKANARHVEQVILPKLSGLEARHQAPLLSALLPSLFHCDRWSRKKWRLAGMPRAVWTAVQTHFSNLPPDLRQTALMNFVAKINKSTSAAWNWAHEATRKLPKQNQPEVLWALLSVDDLDEDGDIRPTRKVLSAVSDLPVKFRAMPLWNAQVAKNNADDDALNIFSYMQSCWSLFRLKSSLPQADKF